MKSYDTLHVKITIRRRITLILHNMPCWCRDRPSHPLLSACPAFWHTLQCVLSAVPPRDTERPAPSASSARRVRDSQPARTKFIHPKVSRVCHERALLQSERREESVHSFFMESTVTTRAITFKKNKCLGLQKHLIKYDKMSLKTAGRFSAVRLGYFLHLWKKKDAPSHKYCNLSMFYLHRDLIKIYDCWRRHFLLQCQLQIQWRQIAEAPLEMHWFLSFKCSTKKTAGTHKKILRQN